MATTGEGWGGGEWGKTPWGAGEAELALLDAQVIRENCIRLEFSVAPLFDGLLTPHDASNPGRFAVAAVSGIALDGESVRPVLPVLVQIASVTAGAGRFLDVWVDRPLTGYPAIYRVSANGLISQSGGSALSPGASTTFYGVRAGKPPPTTEHLVASRDLLIAQTIRELEGAHVPGDPQASVGVLAVDSSGDYASGTPLAGYRTRVIRRAASVLDSFSHLPSGYGTRLPSLVKTPFHQAGADAVAAQIRAQVMLEPETISVTVTASITNRGVATFRILAKGRIGDVDAVVEAP